MQAEINKQLNDKNLNCEVLVKYLRGGNLDTISDMGVQELKDNNTFAGCYLFAGVNNLTRKVGKGCKLRNDSVKTTEKYIIPEFEKAYAKLSKDCPKVTICHLIGLDIAVYNKMPAHTFEWEQNVINNSVCNINLQINKMNIAHHVKGPWLADTIHATTGSHTTHKYKMLPDGLHPDVKTTKIWAKKIIASISIM